MSEYLEGRTSAIFSIGTKIEDLSESFEKETNNLDAFKTAFATVVKNLDNFKNNVHNDAQTEKLNLKESEYAKFYISKCIEIVLQLYNENEVKRHRTSGAADALKQAVSEIKRFYDEEKEKLVNNEEVTISTKEISNFPTTETRQVGESPGSPLEDYKNSLKEEEAEPVVDKSKIEKRLNEIKQMKKSKTALSKKS